MVKLLILFQRPADENAFELAYNKTLAALEKMPGIVRRQANMVLGGPGGASPYYRMLELYFDSFQDLDTAMLSPAGANAGELLIGTLGEVTELVFVDVFEDNSPPTAE